MVGRARVELATSRLSGVRSNHLSYRPIRARGNKCRTRQQPRRLTKNRPRQTVPQHALWQSPVMKGHEDDGMFCRRIGSTQREINSQAIRSILRKEVIQPQVPLRLPCYDFTPVADPTVVSCLLAVSALPSGETNSHGVTGGVYKAWERIHRGMLIRDY